MTTQPTPPPAGEETAPVEAQPSVEAGGPPRDESGRFQAAQPPVIQQPTAPGSGPTPDQMSAFYNDFADPQRAPEAFMREARRLGIVPEGMSIDGVRQAASEFHAFTQGQQQQPPGQQPQQQPGGPWQGQQQPDDGQYLDLDAFQGQTVEAVLRALDQRDQAVQAQRMEQEQQQNLNVLLTAGQGIAQQNGYTDEQHQQLIDMAATRIDRAIAAGQRVDFSPEAMQSFVGSIVTELQSWGAPPPAQTPEQVAAQQQQIAGHRAVAPQTTAPTGPGQAGAPGGPRGMAGVRARFAQGQGQ